MKKIEKKPSVLLILAFLTLASAIAYKTVVDPEKGLWKPETGHSTETANSSARISVVEQTPDMPGEVAESEPRETISPAAADASTEGVRTLQPDEVPPEIIARLEQLCADLRVATLIRDSGRARDAMARLSAFMPKYQERISRWLLLEEPTQFYGFLFLVLEDADDRSAANLASFLSRKSPLLSIYPPDAPVRDSLDIYRQALDLLFRIDPAAARGIALAEIGTTWDPETRFKFAAILTSSHETDCRLRVEEYVLAERDFEKIRQIAPLYASMLDASSKEKLFELYHSLGDGPARFELVPEMEKVDAERTYNLLVNGYRNAGEDEEVYKPRFIEAIGTLAHPEAAGFLKSVFENEEDEVLRRRAFQAYIGTGPADLDLTLIETVQSDPDWRLQAESMRKLGEMEHPETPQLCIEIVDDRARNPVVRQIAITQIGASPTEVNRLLLQGIAGAGEEPSQVRESAIAAIGRLQNPADVEVLHKIAENQAEATTIRVAAIRALGGFPRSVVLPLLEPMTHRETDPAIKNQLERTIAALR
ncbi:MAG: HEAT repeat domain-containing protein [Planctomycetes bacterium]|nr:HEAT repeat domain-containing protein [Planctomycetota bacterium]